MQFRRIIAEHQLIFGIDRRFSSLHVQIEQPHVSGLYGQGHPFFALTESFFRLLVICNVAGCRIRNSFILTVIDTPRQPLYRTILAYIAVCKITCKTRLQLQCNFVKGCLPVVRVNKFNDRLRSKL